MIVSTNKKPNDVIVSSRLADILQRARKETNKTLRELESTTGISSSQLSRLERAELEAPSFRHIVILADEYGISLDDLALVTGLRVTNKGQSTNTHLIGNKQVVMSLVNLLLAHAADSQLETVADLLRAYVAYVRTRPDSAKNLDKSGTV